MIRRNGRILSGGNAGNRKNELAPTGTVNLERPARDTSVTLC